MKTSLHINFHALSQTVLFNDEESAQAVFDELTKKLNVDRLTRYSNKEENISYTFDSATGPVTVILEKVESIRLFDEDAWNSTTQVLAGEALNLEKEVTKKRAMLELERAYR